MDMEKLRNEIDEIDDSLVKLFEKRMQSTARSTRRSTPFPYPTAQENVR